MSRPEVSCEGWRLFNEARTLQIQTSIYINVAKKKKKERRCASFRKLYTSTLLLIWSRAETLKYLPSLLKWKHRFTLECYPSDFLMLKYRSNRFQKGNTSKQLYLHLYVRYLSFQWREVKVIRFYKKNTTQVKYRNSNSVLE